MCTCPPGCLLTSSWSEGKHEDLSLPNVDPVFIFSLVILFFLRIQEFATNLKEERDQKKLEQAAELKEKQEKEAKEQAKDVVAVKELKAVATLEGLTEARGEVPKKAATTKVGAE